jgi:hypothetical protein
MKTAILRIFGGGLVAAGLFVAFPASADLLSYTDTRAVSPADTRFDPANPVVFNISQFDSSLGTLVSVTLSVSGSATWSLNFTNISTTSNARLTASETNGLFINYNSGVLAQNNFIWLTTGYPTRQTVSMNGGIYSQSWGPATVQSLNTFTLAPDLANFIGTGGIPVSARFDVWFDMTTLGGNNRWSVATSSTFTANVTYDYTPVPEPSSFALLFGGLLLLPATRRALRRNRLTKPCTH